MGRNQEASPAQIMTHSRGLALVTVRTYFSVHFFPPWLFYHIANEKSNATDSSKSVASLRAAVLGHMIGGDAPLRVFSWASGPISGGQNTHIPSAKHLNRETGWFLVKLRQFSCNLCAS